MYSSSLKKVTDIQEKESSSLVLKYRRSHSKGKQNDIYRLKTKNSAAADQKQNKKRKEALADIEPFRVHLNEKF